MGNGEGLASAKITQDAAKRSGPIRDSGNSRRNGTNISRRSPQAQAVQDHEYSYLDDDGDCVAPVKKSIKLKVEMIETQAQPQTQTQTAAEAAVKTQTRTLKLAPVAAPEQENAAATASVPIPIPRIRYQHNIVNVNTSDNVSTKRRVAVLGMSPAFITDVLRMNELRQLHDRHYDTLTVSEMPTKDLGANHNHVTTDFSTARGWNELLECFCSIIVLDYSWFQRKY